VISLNLFTFRTRADNPSAQKANLPELSSRLETILAAKYRLVKHLGSGGMSTVWLARHRVHGALFAIKVLHPFLGEHPQFREAFVHEAAHTAVLSGHPNIVPIFDIDHADGLHYIVMPYVRGHDLDQVLQQCGTLNRADALTVALEIASALAYAEERGIIHGDLSPGNVRIDGFGRVLLLDFGLSAPQHVFAPNSSVLLGTPYSMSPERLAGERPGIRSDLYSLGVLLFHMLIGHPPFEGKSVEAIEKWHREGVLHFPDAFTQGHKSLAELIERLLAKHVQDRPANAKSLETLLRDLGAESHPLELSHDLPADEKIGAMRRRLS
jgi:serine/threonine-protein kinase